MMTRTLDPQPEPGHTQRPPSPLRNSFDDDDNDNDFATNVGALVAPSSPARSAASSSALPTDAQLEADAQRARDSTRRAAERILMLEAEDRRRVEERVLAMMHSSPQRAQSLPDPPSASPATSQKDAILGWFAAAKTRLTPTKEPLTPAQQIIHDTKAKDKADKKNTKPKDRSREWPASPERKFADPAFLNLTTPTVPRVPVPRTPPSPSPSPSPSPALHAPSRSLPSLSSPTPSPAHPAYAHFSPAGTLDVPATLLAVARRFEKLERWTVAHVRALEERMGDVERWLVDKEHKDQQQPAPVDAVNEIRDDLAELQGRVGALGREVALLATAPSLLAPAPARPPPAPSPAPHPRLHSESPSLVAPSPPPHAPASSTARESTSPPPLRSPPSAGGSRPRLPYPTGDYAPPAPGLPRGTSSDLFRPAPASPPRARSASPSPRAPPRKRYTVALGAPLVPPAERARRERERAGREAQRAAGDAAQEEEEHEGNGEDHDHDQDQDQDDDDGDDGEFGGSTIGRSSGHVLAGPAPLLTRSPSASPPPPPPPPQQQAHARARPQSLSAAPAPVAPLRPRVRARSAVSPPLPGPAAGGPFVDPLVLRRQASAAPAPAPDAAGAGGAQGARGKVAPGAGRKKLPVGELVAFFDGERRGG